MFPNLNCGKQSDDELERDGDFFKEDRRSPALVNGAHCQNFGVHPFGDDHHAGIVELYEHLCIPQEHLRLISR